MNEYMKKFDDFCEDFFVKKLPALPKNFKDFLVKFAPIGAIILVVFALPMVLFGLGLGALMAPFAAFTFRYRAYGGGMVSMVLVLISIVLQALAIAPLKARKLNGWRFLLYSTLVTFLSSILRFQLGDLLGLAIGLYILYQIKEEYK